MSSTTELLVGIDSLSEIVGELDGEPISDDLHEIFPPDVADALRSAASRTRPEEVTRP